MKEDPLGYTEEELVSLQDCKPRFACPRCKEKRWASTTLFHSTPTKLWKSESTCVSCKKPVRWLCDPDKTIEDQSDDMHRPIGFI